MHCAAIKHLKSFLLGKQSAKMLKFQQKEGVVRLCLHTITFMTRFQTKKSTFRETQTEENLTRVYNPLENCCDIFDLCVYIQVDYFFLLLQILDESLVQFVSFQISFSNIRRSPKSIRALWQV